MIKGRRLSSKRKWRSNGVALKKAVRISPQISMRYYNSICKVFVNKSEKNENEETWIIMGMDEIIMKKATSWRSLLNRSAARIHLLLSQNTLFSLPLITFKVKEGRVLLALNDKKEDEKRMERSVPEVVEDVKVIAEVVRGDNGVNKSINVDHSIPCVVFGYLNFTDMIKIATLCRTSRLMNMSCKKFIVDSRLFFACSSQDHNSVIIKCSSNEGKVVAHWNTSRRSSVLIEGSNHILNHCGGSHLLADKGGAHFHPSYSRFLNNKRCYLQLSSPSKDFNIQASFCVEAIIFPLAIDFHEFNNPIVSTQSPLAGWELRMSEDGPTISFSYDCNKEGRAKYFEPPPNALEDNETGLLNSWHHIAFQVNSSMQASVWLDGKCTGAWNLPFKSNFFRQSSKLVTIAASATWERYFNGCIKDVRVSRSFLQPHQFLTIHNRRDI